MFVVALVSVGFSVPTISVLEGVGLLTVCINKSADTFVPVTVRAEPLPLTANFDAGCNIIVHSVVAVDLVCYLLLSDFMMSQDQLEIVFERTDRQKCFSVQLVDDSVQEVDEIFQLLITSASPVDSRMQLDLTTVTVTIMDDDIGKFISGICNKSTDMQF